MTWLNKNFIISLDLFICMNESDYLVHLVCFSRLHFKMAKLWPQDFISVWRTMLASVQLLRSVAKSLAATAACLIDDWDMASEIRAMVLAHAEELS